MRTHTQDGQLSLFAQDTCAGRTCPAHSAPDRPRGRTSGSSSRRYAKLAAIPYMSLDLTPGHGNLLGESYWELRSPWLGGSWTLNTGVSPRDERVSSLSLILEDSPPRKYYLSRKACLGILRRSRERRKPLPHTLEIALMAQAGLIRITGRIDVEPPVFHINQRDEAIDLGDISGALMATANMQMQTFVSSPMTAFAANQRDEVRDLHDVAGALSAQPGVKQQTFVANCLNPWDTQQARVFLPDGIAPTLAGADGGGCRNPGGVVFTAGFCAGAGPSAGSIGYQEELAPTLKAAPSGNMMPSILCLNDQGGQMMELSKDISGTLRAQEHGHQPLVLYENHGIDARYTGPHEVAPTLSARAGTGGNNLPLLSVGLFERQRCDKFRTGGTASTQSSRQHKDATDLIYQDAEGWPLLIRRLTPLECERLQGFPDGWTALPGAADSKRYKALGNSVAVPCVVYIMLGIAIASR